MGFGVAAADADADENEVAKAAGGPIKTYL